MAFLTLLGAWKELSRDVCEVLGATSSISVSWEAGNCSSPAPWPWDGDEAAFSEESPRLPPNEGKGKANHGQNLIQRMVSYRGAWTGRAARSCCRRTNTRGSRELPAAASQNKSASVMLFNAKQATYLWQRLESIKGTLNSRCLSASQKSGRKAGGVAGFLENTRSRISLK